MSQGPGEAEIPEAASQSRLRRARELLTHAPVIDGHNDLPWAMRKAADYDLEAVDLGEGAAQFHTDLPRLRRGGVGGQFWSVYVPAELSGDEAVAATLEQIDFVFQLVAAYPERLQLATTADEIRAATAGGRVAALMGAEGGHSINCSLGTLRTLFRLGVRYMTLTHSRNVPWADSATDSPSCQGLSPFGRDVVWEMQRLGMLVDLSHVSEPVMIQALEVAEAPVIFSHSSARALCPHPRDVPDHVLQALARNGGVCMVTFVSQFISRDYYEWAEALTAAGPEPASDQERRAFELSWSRDHPAPAVTVADVADHIDHVRQVAGLAHVGLGGDFDGTTSLPQGLEDVSGYPNLFAELLDRGWSPADCAQLAQGNLLRALSEAEAAARAWRSTRRPSRARYHPGAEAGEVQPTGIDRHTTVAKV